MSTPHPSISVICVYNDLAVRQQCLDRSIQALCDEASDVEYLPIDNMNGAYASAGAALNHGASLARNDVVVFVHQDVFLHSLEALKEAARQMQPGGFGLLGAVGVRSDGRLLGRIRDRVILAGDAVVRPTDVDSVDEVLFLAPRSQLLRHPLTESGDMAWHGYAIEYSLRIRRQGLRTGVADIPLTHNSLSVNLERLDVAQHTIAERYADVLPVHTTCGLITSKAAKTGSRVWFSSHRWRYRWLRDSFAVQDAGTTAGRTVGVLADIRRDVDSVIGRSPGRRLYIINCCRGRFLERGPNQLELPRRDGSVVLATCGISDVSAVLASRPAGYWLLLTNLSPPDIKALDSRLRATPSVLGFHVSTGFWLLFGAPFTDLPPQWRSRRATPLGKHALVAKLGA